MQQPLRVHYTNSPITTLKSIFSLEQDVDYLCKYIFPKCMSSSLSRYSLRIKISCFPYYLNAFGTNQYF